MKKCLKFILVILLVTLILPVNYSKARQTAVSLTDGGESTPEISTCSVSSVVGDVDVDTKTPKSNISGINDLIATILGFLQVLSGLISVVVIALTGFRYITADTPDFKRELKEKMLPIVIGMVLVFGAVSITNFILGVTS